MQTCCFCFLLTPQKLNSICLLRHLVQQELGNSSLCHQRWRILVGAELTCTAGHGHVLGLGSGHVLLLLLHQQTKQLLGEHCTRLQMALKWSPASALSRGIPKDIAVTSDFLVCSRLCPTRGKKHGEVTGPSAGATGHPLSWTCWTQDIVI